MDQNTFRGDLAETCFPKLLGLIWREGKSGRLSVRRGPEEKAFTFEGGTWSIGPGTFDAPGFLKWLAARGLAGPADLARAEALAGGNAGGLMRGLIEEGVLPVARSWELAAAFSKDRIHKVFDWTEGTYDLGPAPVPAETYWVRGVGLPGLILEGVRRMGNFTVIEGGLPGPDERLRLLVPRGGEPVALASHERYVLSAADGAERLGEIVRTSPLGAKETKRALFALLVLGLMGTEHGDRPSAEYSLGDMDRLFEAFNARCSFIYKYISKEIGPVALNVIEKSLEEVRGRIDPAFQTCVVKPDGRIELRTLLRKNLGVSSDAGKRSLLRSFDEILAAEVLAVKRTLGNGHESALVKGLERMGDLP
jgi:Domain of unknown function (DUF4388)